MPLREHPAYQQEVKRLDETIKYIEDAITATEENRKTHKEEIKDAFVNLDYLDSSQSYVSILVNAKLLDELEKNFDSLVKSRKKPYFARIDFKQEGHSKTDNFYIGKMSLSRAEWDIPMIVDWRSPLASVYYDGRLGEVSYQTNAGTVKGELSLKRQYTIENGELENIMDIDITATDAFLQASLEGNKDNRLKDIVSTIQAEQNAIIRADIDKPLIVQGVAGSGKTTIALHRIAYLIYTYEENFDPENFMIIAPNRLFLNYISEVLPELGVDKVKQTTYIDYIFELIGGKYKLTNADEKLVSIINHSHDGETDGRHRLLKKAAAFKGSMTFKNIIERYIRDVERSFVPDEDFSLEGYTLISANEIKRLFIKDYGYLPLYKRIDEIKKNLTNRVKANKPKILEEIEQYYDKQIEYLRDNEPETEERRKRIVKLIDTRDHALEVIKKSARTVIAKYIAKFPKRDLFDYYRNLITKEESLTEYSNGKLSAEFIGYICKYSENILSKKHMELEDLAALAYLKHRIFGFEKKIDIKYVVIDEAQDFSHFQFYALKEIVNTQLFTILGDLSQGIHAYRGIKNWDFVLTKIFDPQKSQYLTLEQSYRTTVQIMDMANELIKMCQIEGLILAKPVVRHGKKPEVFQLDSRNEIIDGVLGKIKELKSEGYRSIAVIGKTLKECISIQKYLNKNKALEVKLLDGKENSYEHDVVVVPSYLAKGLEFDAVIIVNIEDTYTEDELDLKLLYVAMTRALHRMYVFCKQDTIPVLGKIEPKKEK
ncbi:RNA polymerase recycling motor HelD [Petroclostridium sp. X23]|uniref:RNA polymerase recycling motor HelD n=1 Tax=Petroclostridium sp. X23 TaxID=3045146 RepID=UPI0024AD59AD|nr:RNA polymerase recycling motor HelD [Petroclostridium sp. X23]WHH60949.1 RNA polymerase recycling motor HelD [Petroclostridium sp. X23]